MKPDFDKNPILVQDELISQIKKLESENVELKNTIGHWQIKNKALKWDNVQRDIDNLLQERGSLKEQVKDYEQALKFDCGNKCNAEYNPCNAREVLKKWGGM